MWVVTTFRGRPRSEEIEHVVLAATTALLEEHGYEALRMKDIAARAGVGLGALYRRWSGKRELVAASLRAGTRREAPVSGGSAIDDLVAALVRISGAVDHGLDMLAAAALREPSSEIAAVAREAKLQPMVEAVESSLQRCVGPADDLRTRAEIGPAFILWRRASTGASPDEHDIRTLLLPLMGVAAADEPDE